MDFSNSLKTFLEFKHLEWHFWHVCFLNTLLIAPFAKRVGGCPAWSSGGRVEGVLEPPLPRDGLVELGDAQQQPLSACEHAEHCDRKLSPFFPGTAQ